MSAPTTSILLNSTNPVAPDGFVNAKPQSDGATPLQSITHYVAKVGGVSAKTANYMAVAADNGTLLSFNSSSPVTLTLPAAPPMAIWKVSVQNVGTGTLTVSRNSLNIDGAATNLTLAQGSGVVIFTDGTNYFTERGSGGGGGSTFGGDLATVDSTHQKVVGLNGTPIDTSISPTDGMTLQYNASTGKYVPVFDRATRPVSAVPGKPSAGQLVLIYTAEATETFPANFASPQSYGSLGVNPTATAVYTVFKNATNVGTVSISTSGTFTFATTSGAAFTLNAGDRFTMVAPGSQDTTLSDVAITLVGTRGAVSASISAPPPVATWRGAYSGSTAYNLYDEVSYLGSSYICIAATTGNLPTNASFWNLLASAGTNGTNGQVLIVDEQNHTYSYVSGGGSANAYTASPSTAYGTAVDGQKIAVKIPATNTLASTLNVSGLGTGTIKKVSATGLVDVAAGDLQLGGIYEFTRNGSIWQLTGGSGGGAGGSVAPSVTLYKPLAANFTTWINQGAGTAVDGQTGVLVTWAPAGANVVTAVLTPFSAATKWEVLTRGAIPNNNFNSHSIYLYETATTKGLAFGFHQNSGGYDWEGFTGSSRTSFNGLSNPAYQAAPLPWTRFRISGSTIFFEISETGEEWVAAGSIANSTAFTTAPDKCGFAAPDSGTAYTSVIQSARAY